MTDAAAHRARAADLRRQMTGVRDETALRELERRAADHDRAADCLEGGPELLADGQEEVFSRTEVETGAIEHKAETGETP
ncbi:MAG: hypothetical protein V4466_16425 [Pseudomonadota bacterium]